MKEAEKYLKSRYGATGHFKVPDGYFDSLASRVMESLPADKTNVVRMPFSAWRGMVVPLSAVAASAVLAVCILLNDGKDVQVNRQPLASQIETSVTYEDADIDAMTNYAMVDAADMYAYISTTE